MSTRRRSVGVVKAEGVEAGVEGRAQVGVGRQVGTVVVVANGGVHAEVRSS